MNITRLLKRLSEIDVKLRVENDELRISAPKGVLDAELREEIQKNKSGIIKALHSAGDLKRVSTLPIERLEPQDYYPLTHAQERLWLVSRLVDDVSPYNLCYVIRLVGKLNPQALERSLDQLVSRHDSLRTTFTAVNGEPRQRVSSQLANYMTHVDLRHLPGPEKDQLREQMVREEMMRPFDLETGPLLRVNLFRLDEDEYVFVINMHHIISDGWSMGVFFSEFELLYKAIDSEQEATLPPLALRYFDYAVWQRNLLGDNVLDEQLRYWREKLKDLSTLQLPTDYPRASTQTYRGADVIQVLSPETNEKLEAISQNQGSTLFMTLLTAFNFLLHKYSGQDDIVVGSPVANRSQPDLEKVIGFFINMLVLRTDVSGDPTFYELLQKVKETSLSAYQYQDVPLEKLVEDLQYERDLSRNPLFQVVFALQNATSALFNIAGVELSGVEQKLETTRFDFEAHIFQVEKGLGIRFVYNSDLFDASTVSRMLDHYVRILQQVADNPERRLSQLSILSEAEQQRLLVDFNRTGFEYRRDLNIVALVEAQAQTTADALAVAADDQELTYRQLNEQANRLAHYLVAQGAGAGVLLGICVTRSIEMVVAQLAVLKTGSAYVPIDPDYPDQRLSFILKDTGAPILLTQSNMLERVADYSGIVFCLDTEGQTLDEQNCYNLEVQQTEEDLAYVMYTSGSTGEPKGVEVTHGGLTNLVSWHCRTYQVTAADRATHLAGLGFDASVWELWPYLGCGASIHLVPEEQRLNPASLLSWMATQAITLSFIPTPLAEAALQEALPDNLQLRVLLTGGDRLHGGLVDKELPFRVVNHYGPTENTVVATCAEVDFMSAGDPSIGKPIDNVRTYILDQYQQPVPVGVSGELYIGGDSLARGYLNRAELSAEKFVVNPFSDRPGERLYRTGDIARYSADGSIEFIGRVDQQVKLRGFRIEPGEIEAILNRQPGVENTVVMVRGDEVEDRRLVAYIVSAADQSFNVDELQSLLLETLPAYMVPSAFVFLDELPLTGNGKVDKDALPAPDIDINQKGSFIAPRNDLETKIGDIWKQVLKLEQVGIHDNFFQLGGNSLLLAQVYEKVRAVHETRFAILELFKYPSISTLAAHLSGEKSTTEESPGPARKNPRKPDRGYEPIAVIGMTGRFPGADSVEAFWNNLHDGVESITFLSDDELHRAGATDEFLENPAFVGAVSRLENVVMFDAKFFDYSPRQAQIIDPQNRFLLECSWEVMERAGYNPDRYPGEVGVYVGSGTNEYITIQLYEMLYGSGHGGTGTYSYMDAHMGSDKDFLATRISYNLNLKGPGITLQTSCSTSLVATHLAIQGLQQRDCDMAIVGGSTVRGYDSNGYMYVEGGIQSPDGHCRAFDADAKGTIGGDGTAVVLLKRLRDALADGDQVYALIKGSAINNDGSQKAGYTTPSIQGQSRCVAAAQAMADVEPRSISYIEAHGTGTVLGDPIEIAALTQTFRQQTQDKHFCAVGSLKTNVGHLESAAGVAGLIKTSMALWHKELPPSLHYHRPNPEIDFDNSPFYVNAELKPWKAETTPRRAGVSSFGIGGTNAHAVLEEAPLIEPSTAARPWQLLVLSAKTPTALDQMTDNLQQYLQDNADVNLADLAYTLQMGRREFIHRRVVVCEDAPDAIEALANRDPRRVLDGVAQDTDYPAVFMFTGQGAQYPNMGLQLYRHQSVYRQIVDQCSEILQDHLGLDLRELLFPAADAQDEEQARLNQTEFTQSALFVTEYALAQLWMSWGITPAAMIGHSIGEYVAACLSGVMSLEAALELVAARGRLMGAMPQGSMLAVPLAEAELIPLLGDDLEIASINGAQLCVVSGPDQAIDALGPRLDEIGIQGQRLHTSHAFHSAMMEPVLEPFKEVVGRLMLEPPKIPYLSNVTGSWITAEEAIQPQYYGTHLRGAVRFSDGLEQVFAEPGCLLLEVGPGHTLSGLAKIHPARQKTHTIVSSLRHASEAQSDEAFMWQAIGNLWLAGGRLDWEAMHQQERRHRILLPTYPFERECYWLEQKHAAAAPAVEVDRNTGSQKLHDPDQWCYLPVWKSSQTIDVDVRNEQDYAGRWLIFQDQSGLVKLLADHIEKLGGKVIRVVAGEDFNKTGPGRYQLNPGYREDYRLLFDDPEVYKIEPARIIHAWGLGNVESSALDGALQSGYYSMLYLVQAIGERWPLPRMHIDVMTRNVQNVIGSERLCPQNALVLGLCNTVRIEYPGVSCRSIDIELPETDDQPEPIMVSALLGELGATRGNTQVAYRSNRRWISEYEIANPEYVTGSPRLRDKGVYLITGGVGGVGLVMAEHLAKTVGARLILTGRTELPAVSQWDDWLSTHDDDDRTVQKIRKFYALKAMGAELMVAAADTADREQMQALVDTARERFGAIHGVIHAAGVVGGPSFDLIENLTPETCQLQFHPKVHGLLLLKDLFAEQALDFIMPVSSISAVLGGLTFAAYAAANQFMDALSQQQNSMGDMNWISVDWDGWDFDQQNTQGVTASFALTPEEGSAVFDRVLRMGNLPQVIVSTGDLRWRIEQWTSQQEEQKTDIEESATGTTFPRPALSSEYVEPRTDQERILAGIWQDSFGIDPVGVNDNFFELGGDSVLNIQITALAKQAGLILTPRDAFEHQTIAELAVIAAAIKTIEPTQDAAVDDDDEENIESDLSEDDLAEILRQQEM